MRPIALLIPIVIAACGGTQPGTLVNRKVDLAAFPPQDVQLLYQTDAGARVTDLRTRVTFDLGPRGFFIEDVSDDGRTVALVHANRPELAIVQAGVERGRVTLPRYPSYVSLSPDGTHLAGAYSWPSTAETTDELFLVDIASLALTEVAAERRGHMLDSIGWTPGGDAVVVTMDNARLDNRVAAARTPQPVLTYDLATKRRVTLQLAPADVYRTRWLKTHYDREPGTCTTATGETIADWSRLADIRGIVVRPPSAHPISAWGFLDDCAMYLVHDLTLWLIAPSRDAVSLGRVSKNVRPIAFSRKADPTGAGVGR
ncbi:MAG: hypothetical protein SFX73_16765 [Kofleriaceae bacterium]|nr:hypothetical protein [Kofleriaceae bacterium]